MGALVVQGDARALPLPDESVDLVVTSPPYFALRSYRDGDAHYDGQMGSESSPQAFLEALWAVTAECWRVLKPTGSMFVNLGDKRAGTNDYSTPGGTGASSPIHSTKATERSAKGQRLEYGAIRAKSKMLLPHRYAIGCEDGLADPEGIGWVLRQDLVWSKPNSLPESVRDRARDAHEYWFHLAKAGDYFSGVDEIREAHRHEEAPGARRGPSGQNRGTETGRVHDDGRAVGAFNHSTLGKLPGSVWSIPSEPFTAPEWLGVTHFAAFPTEWPRRLILGWSPSGTCNACGEGRRPVTEVEQVLDHLQKQGRGALDGTRPLPEQASGMYGTEVRVVTSSVATIVGYACACTPYTDHPERRGLDWNRGLDRGNGNRVAKREADTRGPVREYHFSSWTPAPTTPAVVLDPFGGTGTVAMVARALGRTGISVDLSADYCRLARWRVFDSGHGAKAIARTDAERQGTLNL